MASTKPAGAMRLTALATALAFSFAASPTAYAQSFLDDYYNNAGSYQGNLSKPGVYQGAGLNVYSGGGFVYKSPQTTFNPYYITGPSLKSGCGGIDIFLGAFGLPSRQEFVAFLRNIGQNVAGLAFQLALKSLSPDLASEVESFRNLILSYSKDFTDSCKAAAKLLETTGANKWIETNVKRAKDSLLASGIASDASDADRMVKTSGGKACDASPTMLDSGGIPQEQCEINTTWAMLSGGAWAVASPIELREFMMTMIGTTIYRKLVPGGGYDDTVIVAYNYPGRDLSDVLYGRLDQPTLSADLQIFECVNGSTSNDVTCLDPSTKPYTDISLANRIYETAKKYRLAIINRNAADVNQDELFLLATTSSIPLLRLVNATASSRYGGFADDLLRVYSEAAAYELTMRFLEQLAGDVARAAKSKHETAGAVLIAKHADQVAERVQAVRSEVRAKSDQVFAQMQRMASFLTQIEHIERSLKGNLAADLAANLRFSQGRL
jgi:conjugative transfer pilus assembly protein TraH